MKALQWFPWPGNVRQLKNAIESASFGAEMHGREDVVLEDLPADISPARDVGAQLPPMQVGQPGFQIEAALAWTELSFIRDALRVAQGKKTEAWRLLGYPNRFALRRRVKRLVISNASSGEAFPEILDAYGSVRKERS
jgi:DNA-binding NtrC family response regulator